LQRRDLMKTRDFIYPTSSRQTQNGQRIYSVNGEALPSVTTILSATKSDREKQILQDWKNRVGAKEADRIRDAAANRGSVMHRIIEGYIKGERHLDMTELGNTAHNMADILIERAIEDRLQEIWGVEPTLVYKGLFAGQTDLVGIHAGVPSICDHKNSNKPKRKEWLHDTYRLQLAAYALAFEDMFGEHIPRGVNFVITPGGYYQEFSWDGEEFRQAKYDWLRKVDQYYNQRKNKA